MSDPPSAVFLSYASQDAEAARRICEALRAGGIEVWFDQSELRGGDAWDQKIRQQIRACALVIPIVSANTQTRLEGYFRREWRMAVDRTLDMADGKPFLVPVAVDDTQDRTAHVPEAFRAVQWTRLPGGETTPAFVERMSKLLSGESLAPLKPEPLTSRAPVKEAAKQRTPLARALRVAIILAAIFVGFLFYRAGNEEDAVPPPPPQAPGTAAKGAISTADADKSIAVLPFVDMSEKHDQEYFSDGLAEELLNLLSKVPDLQVIARTSSFSFKGTTDDIPTIAKKLSVAHVLEGSVRKSGRRMRITTQLVRADTGTQVWSETYDRDVEDVFTVQDDIARIVVEKLKGTLLAGAPVVVARTTNPEAHTLYLQAQYQRALDTDAGLDAAVANYQKALQLDPEYAPAWSGLSTAYSRILANGVRPGDPHIALARTAAQNAIRLDPDAGDAYGTLAFLDMMTDFHWAKAAQTLAQGRAREPGNANVLYISGVNARAQGQDSAAVGFFEQALQRDPVNLLTRRYYARTLLQAQRVADAEVQARKLLQISPAFPAANYTLALILLDQGKAREALAAMQAESASSWRELGMPIVLRAVGRTAEINAAVSTMLARRVGADFQFAEAYAYLGRTDEAFKWLNAALRNRDAGVMWARGDPLLRSLAKDPRFAAFVRQANLAN